MANQVAGIAEMSCYLPNTSFNDGEVKYAKKLVDPHSTESTFILWCLLKWRMRRWELNFWNLMQQKSCQKRNYKVILLLYDLGFIICGQSTALFNFCYVFIYFRNSDRPGWGVKGWGGRSAKLTLPFNLAMVCFQIKFPEVFLKPCGAPLVEDECVGVGLQFIHTNAVLFTFIYSFKQIPVVHC
jgi:hypothetical protein